MKLNTHFNDLHGCPLALHIDQDLAQLKYFSIEEHTKV